jgi:uncharacterized protein (TIGR02266 family)
MDRAATGKTVLVADDTAFVRDRFKAALEGAGYRVITVTTAAELLATVHGERDQLDLLIVDLRLPQAKGVDVIRNIRTLDHGQLPILVFSGTITAAEEVRELAALGVAGYVNEYSAVHHILPSLAPHLSPEQFNRRSSPRVTLGIPIAYRVGNTIAAALAFNLSHQGIAIRTATPLAVGAKARLRFRLPGSKKDIDADAIVRWSRTTTGMGLQFEHVDEPDRRAIDEFVDLHFFRSRKA